MESEVDRNEGTFDLSPVINLLQALSPSSRPQAAKNELQRIPHRHQTPRLGDFTTLWDFLGYEPLTRANTPVKQLGLPKPPTVPSTPESPKPERTIMLNGPVAPGYRGPSGLQGKIVFKEDVADDGHITKTASPGSKLKSLSSPTPITVIKSTYMPQAIPAPIPAPLLGATTSNIPMVDPNAATGMGPKGKPKPIQPLTPVKAESPVKRRQKRPLTPPPPKTPIKSMKVGDKQEFWAVRPTVQSTGSPLTKKMTLIKKLTDRFPNDARTLQTAPLQSHSLQMNPSNLIHVFIDNSNIVIGYADLVKLRNGFKKHEYVNYPSMSFHNLSLILERGRPTGRKVLVGSHPVTPVIEEARLLKYHTKILEKVAVQPEPPRRNSSGSSSSGSEGSVIKKRKKKKAEQGVDEILNLSMLEVLLDYSKPTTIVLASGDGAVGQFSEGFFKVVERALDRGWVIELATFSATMSKSYTDRNFRQRWAKQFRIILLDEYVDELAG